MLPNPATHRRQVTAAATELAHPTKTGLVLTTRERARMAAAGQVPSPGARHGTHPHPFGRLVYFGHDPRMTGWVGGRFKKRYLIAHGADTQDSLWALAHHLGFEARDPGVEVVEVDAGEFWLHCLPAGYQG